MTSIGKETEAVNAYLIKNSKGEVGGGGGEKKRKKVKRRGKKKGGGGGGGGSSEGIQNDWAELYGCIK